MIWWHLVYIIFLCIHNYYHTRYYRTQVQVIQNMSGKIIFLWNFQEHTKKYFQGTEVLQIESTAFRRKPKTTRQWRHWRSWYKDISYLFLPLVCPSVLQANNWKIGRCASFHQWFMAPSAGQPINLSTHVDNRCWYNTMSKIPQWSHVYRIQASCLALRQDACIL